MLIVTNANQSEIYLKRNFVTENTYLRQYEAFQSFTKSHTSFTTRVNFDVRLMLQFVADTVKYIPTVPCNIK